MNSTVTIIFSVISIVAMAFVWYMESRRDLMMLQQNSYRSERYRRWLKASADTTSMPKLLSYIIFFIAISGFNLKIVALVAMVLFGLIQGLRLLRAKYKKPLAMTGRVRRLLTTILLLSVIVIAVSIPLFGIDSLTNTLYVVAISLTGCYCASHILTLVALWVMKPVEKHINNKFISQARAKLQDMPDLKIVGITGSYGKTSTKHYLHSILSEHFDTLMTPGSFNTTLGVVRTINEYLKPYNEVFIVEMGAKQPGDIAEICNLVHPQIGILTAVGSQHLETFKTIERVRDTKFELVDALPADGLAIINNDFAPIAGREVENVAVIRYGVSNAEGCNYTASDISYGADGTTFTVTGNGRSLKLTTSLLGECNISNLVAAIAAATALGVPDEKIVYAVSRIQPVEHRLSSRRLPSGLTIIDDAFNSNPSGSRMALDVLASMNHGHRFIITPGMIELGKQQYKLNHEFGRHIASCADTAILVGEYNRQAIQEGLEQGGMSADMILSFPSFNKAFEWVMANHKPGDTVLIENDLPDTFK